MPKEPTHPLKVFLCHASGDKPPVRDLYKRLTAEGVDAWLDQEKLLPGQDWRLEIPRAVHEADVVVVCLSKKSVTKEGYVQKEIKFALDSAEEKPEGAIFLIPARLEECVVPERLGRWQWVDLYDRNGFVKLLRSLKLRADAVGASIEPTLYEDSDKELERRLKQIYTEGLAAFYTEDWDRACHRFQSILSEQPNHKNAMEKLAEAERQRDLAILYVQSMNAVRLEDWQVAIDTLEELSRESADYKDVVQLLKNARKQKQLKELYAEARTLHEAQKWEAVLKVFEQILAIEPAYPDPDGLLSIAQKEVAELKRLADLDDLYSNAVSEMDAGRWVEARRLLEQVHKAQTGFLETERLLRKVEDEITKVEEHNKRNEQVNVLYEQAHGLLRSKKWQKALDKVEEIEKLDVHFEDRDGIAQKAKIELEREEKETQKQNQLAAMYAEAVRLLKEEKYQEALGKWHEVRTIDPKYPDWQWVQRTARKKLAETAKPVQIKPKFVIKRSLWMGIVGLIAVGALIAGVILSGKGNQNVLPTKTIFANPTATKASSNKTSTPHPATAISPASGYSDPTIYDDFDNNAYDNSYNKSLWRIYAGSSNYTIRQEDENISIKVNDSHDAGLDSNKYLVVSKPSFVEARMFLDPATTDAGSSLYLYFYKLYSGGINCRIYGYGNKQDIMCSSSFFGKQVESNLGLDGISPGWHVIRLEIEPETMTISYIVDGRLVGSFVPKDSVPEQFYKLKGPAFHIRVALDNNGPSEAPVGYVDYVRMGAIEDDPTLLFFDDLDGPVLSDDYKAFPTNPSYDYQGEPNFSFETIDGSTVLRMQSNLQPNQFRGWQISRIFTPGTNPVLLEVRFNTLVQSSATSIDGFLNVWLLDGDDSQFIWTGLSAWSYGLDRYFAGEAFDFKDNTWYRLVIIGSKTQELRALLYEDKTGKELVGVNLGNNLSVFKSGIKIGLMQQMGTPTPDAIYPTDVAIDWIRFTIIPDR